MADKPKTIDEYLARVPGDQFEALESLRKCIRAAAPSAAEWMNYQLHYFRLKGMPMVRFNPEQAVGPLASG